MLIRCLMLFLIVLQPAALFAGTSSRPIERPRHPLAEVNAPPKPLSLKVLKSKGETVDSRVKPQGEPVSESKLKQLMKKRAGGAKTEVDVPRFDADRAFSASPAASVDLYSGALVMTEQDLM